MRLIRDAAGEHPGGGLTNDGSLLRHDVDLTLRHSLVPVGAAAGDAVGVAGDDHVDLAPADEVEQVIAFGAARTAVGAQVVVDQHLCSARRDYLRNFEVVLSARTLPAVWQVAQ